MTRIFVMTIALLMVSLLIPVTGCDLPTASGDLNGKWIAYGGMSLEFAYGRFTMTISGGEVRRGTYTTDGSYITFNRTGHSPEIKPYRLSFPRLVVDNVTYFYDSPTAPHNLEATWYGFRGENTTQQWLAFSLSPAKPARDNPWMHEGIFVFFGYFRGDYYLERRNVPDTGTLTMKTNQIYGGALKVILEFELPIYLMELFDWEALKAPLLLEHWWYTLDEARKFYTDAAQRANGDLFLIRQITARMARDLDGIGDTETYEYTLKEYEEDFYDFYGEFMEAGEVLMLKAATGPTATFRRSAYLGSSHNNSDYSVIQTECDCDLPLWVASCFHFPGLEK